MTNEKSTIAGEILAHLNDMSGSEAGEQSLSADSDLMGHGMLDSLNIVRLIQFIESRFSLQIDDDDIEPSLFASANHLADYVLKQQK